MLRPGLAIAQDRPLAGAAFRQGEAHEGRAPASYTSRPGPRPRPVEQVGEEVGLQQAPAEATVKNGLELPVVCARPGKVSLHLRPVRCGDYGLATACCSEHSPAAAAAAAVGRANVHICQMPSASGVSPGTSSGGCLIACVWLHASAACHCCRLLHD